ncbi:hypothetical protein [Streptomyces adelaidensis]|uniref:hypothetical protein n=1 Tax=Streptomyces adelaidensis TaxID=2796465 RepID=UPI001F47B83F|nr:hypothetical protein [Streptomyces adelaidensis]
MSYPTPPQQPGSAGGYGQPPNPYGQPPQPGAWPQGQPPGQPPSQPQQYPAQAPYPGQAPYAAYGGQTPYPGQAPHPAPAPAPAPVPPRPPAAKGGGAARSCLSATLGFFGILGMLGGGLLVGHAYSNASQDIPNRDGYGPTLWRNEPADKLFPDALAPRLSVTNTKPDAARATWHRVGISEDTECAKGLNKVTSAAVAKLDCEAVLRATYVDPTGNTIGTVALIVLPAGESAKTEMTAFFEKDEDKLDPEVGVKAFAVPDTIAAKWSDARSNGGAGIAVPESSLPYVIVASTGAVDGREAGQLPGEYGSHNWDAGDDRAPWRGSAKALCEDVGYHLGDLLLETS